MRPCAGCGQWGAYCTCQQDRLDALCADLEQVNQLRAQLDLIETRITDAIIEEASK